MATAQMDTVIRYLRRLVMRQDGAARSDGQLLASFIEQKDEAAFEALVHRHGPMVFGVCRRLLRNHHDAEDAFQATFLVLARKAQSVRPRERVANWLHGVALRTAMKAKTLTAKRSGREKQVTEMPEPEATQQEQWRDIQPLLDQELNGLPENYRLPILLCDLEGKTIKEAAQQLGWPQGTLAGRLARGRKLLAKRLTNRGVVLSAGSLAVIVSQNVASAGVPTSLVSSTVKAVTLVAAGQAAEGAISVKVAALTEGVLKSMLLTKLKTVVTVPLVMALALGGGAGLLYQTQAAETPKARQGDQTPKAEKTDPTAKQGDGNNKQPIAATKDEKPKNPPEPVPATAELRRLPVGTWKAVGLNVDGKARFFDLLLNEQPVTGIKWTFTGSKIKMQGGDKSIEASYTADDSMGIPKIDLTYKVRAGDAKKEVRGLGIYLLDLDNGNLELFFVPDPQGGVRPQIIDRRGCKGAVYYVFQRVKENDAEQGREKKSASPPTQKREKKSAPAPIQTPPLPLAADGEKPVDPPFRDGEKPTQPPDGEEKDKSAKVGVKADDLNNKTRKALSAIVFLDIEYTNTVERGFAIGVVVDRRGYLLTISDALKGRKNVRAVFSDGSIVDAPSSVVQEGSGLALLKLEKELPKRQRVVKFADPDDCKVGESVWVVRQSDTAKKGNLILKRGIATALNREVTLDGKRTIKGLLQVDQQVDAGSPLLNNDGELLGLAIVPSQKGASLGFALPSDRVEDACNDLRK